MVTKKYNLNKVSLQKLSKYCVSLALFIAIPIYIFAGSQLGIDLYYIKFFLPISIFVILIFIATIFRRSFMLLKSNIAIIICFAMWSFAMIISLIYSEFVYVHLMVVSSYIVLFLLTFVLIPQCINTYDDYFDLNAIFYWAVFFSLMASIVIGAKIGNDWETIGERTRYMACFDNSNDLGLYSLLGCMTTFCHYSFDSQKKYLLLNFLYVPLIWLSDSRNALFSLLILLFLFFYPYVLNKTKNKIIFKYIIFSIITSMILMAAYYVVYIFKMSSIDHDFLDVLLSLRLSRWSIYLSNITDSYVLFFGRGVGSENFKGSISADNYYIATLLQFGLIGLVLFLCFIFTILFKLKKKCLNINMVNVRYSTIAIFVTFAIYSFFENTLFTLGNISSIYFWIIIGIYLNMKYQNRQMIPLRFQDGTNLKEMTF